MVKLRNVTGVPISFDGVKGTVRFLKGQTKEFKESEITKSLRDGIDNGSLLLEQIEEEKPIATQKKSAKKNKEV